MKKTALFFTFSLLAVFSACGKQGTEEPEWDEDKPFEPIVLTKAEAEIGKAANQFGLDVYRQVYSEKQVLISPLSLSLALSMAANGADGSTAEEMLSTLGFKGQSMDDMNSYYQKMVSALLEADPKTTFEVANSIWADERIGLKKSFTDTVDKYYSSEVFPADFSTWKTVNEVNGWVSEKTHGKINSILDSPNRDLVMALINALYFKGEWAFEFDEKTKKENFTTISGKESKVDMMTAHEDLLYSKYDGFEMVTLPYGNGSFRMEVILPDEEEDFGKAVARLDTDIIQGLSGNSINADVTLKLPKFTFEYETSLADVLKDLGMKQAFTNYADFSQMAEKSLKISMVKQKTFIDVNQKGTEAAAVTFIGFVTSAGPVPSKPAVDFFADRPFLFLIREASTGAILFIGQKVS